MDDSDSSTNLSLDTFLGRVREYVAASQEAERELLRFRLLSYAGLETGPLISATPTVADETQRLANHHLGTVFRTFLDKTEPALESLVQAMHETFNWATETDPSVIGPAAYVGTPLDPGKDFRTSVLDVMKSILMTDEYKSPEGIRGLLHQVDTALASAEIITIADVHSQIYQDGHDLAADRVSTSLARSLPQDKQRELVSYLLGGTGEAFQPPGLYERGTTGREIAGLGPTGSTVTGSWDQFRGMGPDVPLGTEEMSDDDEFGLDEAHHAPKDPSRVIPETSAYVLKMMRSVAEGKMDITQGQSAEQLLKEIQNGKDSSTELESSGREMFRNGLMRNLMVLAAAVTSILASDPELSASDTSGAQSRVITAMEKDEQQYGRRRAAGKYGGAHELLFPVAEALGRGRVESSGPRSRRNWDDEHGDIGASAVDSRTDAFVQFNAAPEAQQTAEQRRRKYVKDHQLSTTDETDIAARKTPSNPSKISDPGVEEVERSLPFGLETQPGELDRLLKMREQTEKLAKASRNSFLKQLENAQHLLQESKRPPTLEF